MEWTNKIDSKQMILRQRESRGNFRRSSDLTLLPCLWIRFSMMSAERTSACHRPSVLAKVKCAGHLYPEIAAVLQQCRFLDFRTCRITVPAVKKIVDAGRQPETSTELTGARCDVGHGVPARHRSFGSFSGVNVLRFDADRQPAARNRRNDAHLNQLRRRICERHAGHRIPGSLKCVADFALKLALRFSGQFQSQARASSVFRIFINQEPILGIGMLFDDAGDLIVECGAPEPRVRAQVLLPDEFSGSNSLRPKMRILLRREAIPEE